jgi:mono/diheme cytochrome c family protein
LCVLFSLGACREPDYPYTSEGLFLRHCSRCHESDGSSATASKLAESKIDLRDARLQQELSDAEIAYIMQHGVGRMQGIANLSAAEIDSILLHVRRLGRPERPDLDRLQAPR